VTAVAALLGRIAAAVILAVRQPSAAILNAAPTTKHVVTACARSRFAQ